MLKGSLFICGTPIGNLEDISLRCLKTLKESDIIAAEDTRHTLKLLNYYEIKTPLTSYHEHNKLSKGPKIIDMILEGKNIALVSDAGMPGISDPGSDLIKLCYENDINITVIPGPTAEVTALVLSGLDTRSYCFEGFLPANKKQRKSVIDRIKKDTRTIVLYEAPHHLLKTLKELFEEIGNRNIAAVKELTKKYETVKRGNLKSLIEFFTENEPKGEFVIVIEGIPEDSIKENEKEEWNKISIDEHMNYYINKNIDRKNAMKQVAKDRGVSKREIYNYLNIKEDK